MLVELVRSKKPCFAFLIETLCSKNKLESIKAKLGFEGLLVMDRVGRGGGLAFLWSASCAVNLFSYAPNYIDIEFEVADLGRWRITGFYRYPESNCRRASWNLLCLLFTSSSLSWVCIGDFNDLLAANEKRERHEHPNRKLMGFNSAINDCGLIDLGMDGYKFTWERSRGTENWAEEWLDRAFAADDWVQQFSQVKVCSLESSCFDHLPIFLDPNPKLHAYRNNRFRFENLWLREARCGDVIQSTWASFTNLLIQQKIKDCGKALLVWGRHLARDFPNRKLECKQQMASLRGRRNMDGVAVFIEVRNIYNELLHSHKIFLEAEVEVSLAEGRGLKYTLFSCFGFCMKTEELCWGSS